MNKKLMEIPDEIKKMTIGEFAGVCDQFSRDYETLTIKKKYNDVMITFSCSNINKNRVVEPSPTVEEKVLQLKDQGLTMSEIADAFGFSHEYVKKLIRGNIRDNFYQMPTEERILWMSVTMTDIEIANKIGVSVSYVESITRGR